MTGTWVWLVSEGEKERWGPDVIRCAGAVLGREENDSGGGGGGREVGCWAWTGLCRVGLLPFIFFYTKSFSFLYLSVLILFNHFKHSFEFKLHSNFVCNQILINNTF